MTIGVGIQQTIAPIGGLFFDDGVRRTVNGLYYTSSGDVAGAGATEDFASLENPAGSGRTVYVRRSRVSIFRAGAGVSGFVFLTRTALQTGGATLFPQKRHSSSAAQVAIGRSLPATSTPIGGFIAGCRPGEVVDSSDLFTFDFDGLIVLLPSEGLLWRSVVSSLGQTFAFDFEWFETTVG